MSHSTRPTESLLLHSVDVESLTERIATTVVESLRPLLTSSQRPSLVDTEEMARLSGLSPSSIDRLRRAGAISSTKIGSRRLFDPQTVLAQLTNHGGGE